MDDSEDAYRRRFDPSMRRRLLWHRPLAVVRTVLAAAALGGGAALVAGGVEGGCYLVVVGASLLILVVLDRVAFHLHPRRRPAGWRRRR